MRPGLQIPPSAGTVQTGRPASPIRTDRCATGTARPMMIVMSDPTASWPHGRPDSAYPAPPPATDTTQTVTIPRHLLSDAVDVLDLARPHMGVWGDLGEKTRCDLAEILAANPPAEVAPPTYG